MNGVDLFSGAGGLTLGLKGAGVTPICAVEKKRDAVDTYARHTPDAIHFCEDIHKVNLSPFAGKTDILYGGPPCQPFSTGGLRKGGLDERDMIPAFLAAAEILKPAVILMENVPGLTVRTRFSYLHKVISTFREIGYVPEYKVLNASHYGVPQNRRRLFIVAFKDKPFWFPRPTHGPEAERPLVPSGTIISPEPKGKPPACPVVYAKCPDLRPSPYAGHVYNGGGRPVNLNAPCHTILASAGGYKTHWVDTQGIAVEYHQHLMSGGEPRVGEVPGARRMTMIESALIQTFPADLEFAGSRSSQYTQVGDAVPPLLAEVLGREIIAQLNGIEPSERTHYPPESLQQLSLI